MLEIKLSPEQEQIYNAATRPLDAEITVPGLKNRTATLVSEALLRWERDANRLEQVKAVIDQVPEDTTVETARRIFKGVVRWVIQTRLPFGAYQEQQNSENLDEPISLPSPAEMALSVDITTEKSFLAEQSQKADSLISYNPSERRFEEAITDEILGGIFRSLEPGDIDRDFPTPFFLSRAFGDNFILATKIYIMPYLRTRPTYRNLIDSRRWQEVDKEEIWETMTDKQRGQLVQLWEKAWRRFQFRLEPRTKDGKTEDYRIFEEKNISKDATSLRATLESPLYLMPGEVGSGSQEIDLFISFLGPRFDIRSLEGGWKRIRDFYAHNNNPEEFKKIVLEVTDELENELILWRAYFSYRQIDIQLMDKFVANRRRQNFLSSIPYSLWLLGLDETNVIRERENNERMLAEHARLAAEKNGEDQTRAAITRHVDNMDRIVPVNRRR